MPVGHDPDFTTFARAAEQLGLIITPETYGQLYRYTQLIRQYNEKVNLISRKDTHRILTYHIIDSLAAHRFISPNARSCDLGSGAGFPGIPLALVRPDATFILIESIKKKCRFLETAINELNLKNCSILCARAETLPSLNCDVILSRLTAPLKKTLKYATPHLNPGCSIILYKSASMPEEIDEKLLLKSGLFMVRTVDIILPLSLIPRRFVLLQRRLKD